MWRPVRDWVGRLGDAPWQAPSVPFPEVSDQPNYEIRMALLSDLDGVEGQWVEVFYKQIYEGQIVDLIFVRTR